MIERNSPWTGFRSRGGLVLILFGTRPRRCCHASQTDWKAHHIGRICEIQMKRLRRIQEIIRVVSAQLSQFLLDRIKTFAIASLKTDA